MAAAEQWARYRARTWVEMSESPRVTRAGPPVSSLHSQPVGFVGCESCRRGTTHFSSTVWAISGAGWVVLPHVTSETIA
jgi:hypothetical protein